MNTLGIAEEPHQDLSELQKKIKDLNDELSEKNKTIDDLTLKLKVKDDEIKMKDFRIKELEKKLVNSTDEKLMEKLKENEELIKKKNQELELLEQKIASLETEKFEFETGEDIVEIKFLSEDQKINTLFKYSKAKPFVRAEEKLYEEYPEYKESDNYFIVDGNKIKRFLTLEENNINENGKEITLYKNEK